MFKNIVNITIVLLFFWVVCGFNIPNYEWYVTDKVGVFSETEKTNLTNKIEEIEKTTSIEIAVLVVPTVDDDINLAAVDVGNKRWVGKEGQNNGLLLLIAVDDRKWSIQIGYGLEATLPDLATKRIGETRFPPNFREGNYYQGIMEMLDDALWYIKQDPTIVNTYSQASSTTNDDSFDKYLEFVFFFFIFAISFFGKRVTVPSTITWKNRKMKKYGRWFYAGAWLLLWLIVALILPFIFAIFISYFFLLFGVLMALYDKTGNGWTGIRFGGRWGSFGGGGSSFGWFWGGSFGGGGSSGSR